MLIYANQFHGCCHITLLSNETGGILLFLPLSCKQTSGAQAEPFSHLALRCPMVSVRGGFAGNRGKGGGEGDVCAVMCPLKEKTV